MRIELDFYHAEEFVALGEAFLKIGNAQKLRQATQGEDVAIGPDITQVELPLTGEVNSTPAPAPEATTRRTRRKGPVLVETPVTPAAAPAQAPIDVEPVATDAPKQTEVVVPAPAPTPAGDAPKAEDLANATRALAKKDFEVAKKLLDTFGVKRFGELPVERYAEYAKAIALL